MFCITRADHQPEPGRAASTPLDTNTIKRRLITIAKDIFFIMVPPKR
jgi:hypothetical protein